MSSNIIKGSPTNARPASRGVVIKRVVVDATAEAQRILADAEQEAATLRASAENAARELREAAYQEGREAAMLEITQLLLDIRQRRETVLIEVEQDVLRLAIKLAEKIVGREIEQRDTTLADIVSAALRHARRQEMLVVHVNPADLAAIEAHRENLDSAVRARLLDIVADPRVESGGCLIESESGTVDAQLTTQLRVLERALLAQAATGEGERER